MAIKNIVKGREELEEMFIDQGLSGSELENALNTVDSINKLKKEKNAVILSHYYMRDGIKFGIADYVGDSLDLSKAAMETDADIIVFCGVHFMAETAKILNPEKKVLLPDLSAGCSLAESITIGDVKGLRLQYPDAAFVTYVNTTADVKAECDVCVTSANAVKIVSKIPNKQIVFLPDNYMARNLLQEVPDKEIIYWNGKCIVHEQFSKDQIVKYRRQIPGLKVLAHYECDPSVIETADMHGGTGDMRKYVRNNPADAYLLATECGLASTVKAEFPDKNIVGPCNLCPYMKKIDLYNTLKVLQDEVPEINVNEETRIRALKSLDKMLELGAN